MSSASSQGTADVTHYGLLIVGLCPALLLLIVFTGYFLHSEMMSAWQLQTDKATRLAQRLALQASAGIENWPVDALQAWLARQPEHQQVLSVEIHDLTGRTVRIAAPDTDTGRVFGQQISVDEPVLHFTGDPVNAPDRHPRVSGRVRIVFSSGYLSQRLEESLKTVGVLLLIGLGLLAWLGWHLMVFHILPRRQMDARIRQLVADTHLRTRGGEASLDDLATCLERQRDGFARQRQGLMLMLSRLERLLRESEEKSKILEARVDAERWARLFLLAQLDSELRPCLLNITGHPQGQDSADGLAVLDDLLSNWHQDGAETGSPMAFDPRDCLERLMGLLMVGMPHLSLILLISPDLPGKICGDPIRLTHLLSRWIGQLARVMSRGELTIRVTHSMLGGQPGWCILIHAPVAELTPQVRHGPSFLWSSAGGSVVTVESVIQSMNGRYSVVNGSTGATFYCLHLPFDSREIHSGDSDPFATRSTPAEADRIEPSRLKAVCVCIIDPVSLSRKAWVWQLRSLGVKAIAQETIDNLSASLEGHDAAIRMVVMNVPDSLRHGSRQSAFLEACSGIDAWPVLILPCGDFEGRDYYARTGVACLNQPVSRDDWFKLLHSLIYEKADRQTAVSPAPLPADARETGYAEALLSASRNNRKLACRLWVKLLDELPDEIQAIDQALQSGQITQARDITHKINGSARFCGFIRLGKAATHLERVLIDALETGQNPDYATTLTALKTEIGGLLAEGQNVLQSLS